MKNLTGLNQGLILASVLDWSRLFVRRDDYKSGWARARLDYQPLFGKGACAPPRKARLHT